MKLFLFILALIGITLGMPVAENDIEHPVIPLVIADYSSVVKVEDTPVVIIAAESSEITPSIPANLSSDISESVQIKEQDAVVLNNKKEEKSVDLEINIKPVDETKKEEVKIIQEKKRETEDSGTLPVVKPSEISGPILDVAVSNETFIENTVQPVAVEEPLALPTLELEKSAETLPIAQPVVKSENKSLDLAKEEKEFAALVNKPIPNNVENASDGRTDDNSQEAKDKNEDSIDALKILSIENIFVKKQEEILKETIVKLDAKIEHAEELRVVREAEQSEEKTEHKVVEKVKEKSKNVSTDSSSQESKQEEKIREESKEENKSLESESAEKIENKSEQKPVEKVEEKVLVEDKKNDSSSSSSESS